MGATAVKPKLLDTDDGLGSCGDAWGASEPPNKPVGVVGGVLGHSPFANIFIFIFYFF
jgi:hypothetical protein